MVLDSEDILDTTRGENASSVDSKGGGRLARPWRCAKLMSGPELGPAGLASLQTRGAHDRDLSRTGRGWCRPAVGETLPREDSLPGGGVLQGREEPRRGAGTRCGDSMEQVRDPQRGLGCDGDDNIKGGSNDPENTRWSLRRGGDFTKCTRKYTRNKGCFKNLNCFEKRKVSTESDVVWLVVQ